MGKALYSITSGLLTAYCGLLTCSLLLACSYKPISRTSMDNQLDLQGHRGARGRVPENTVPAMIYALDAGVTTLEMDVVITADSAVLLSHEPFFSSDISSHPDGRPVTKGEEQRLNIYKMPFSATRRFDVGLRGNHRFPEQRKEAAVKPLLSEVFEAAEGYSRQEGRPPVHYNIETKSTPSGDGKWHPPPATFVRLLMEVVERYSLSGRVIIQSFDPRTLQEVHRTHPDVRTALLVDAPDRKGMEVQLKALGFTPSVYSPHFSHVTPQLVTECHRRGMLVIPWTVNDAARMRQLAGLGVDGIISDYPDRFAGLKKIEQ